MTNSIDDKIETDKIYTSEDTIVGLLVEFKEQREALKDMINDLDDLKANIDKLFPEKLDQRYQRFFEEKVKSATGLLNLLLDIRKEITRTIKDEIEIRRRIKDPNDDSNIEEMINVRSIVKKVEKHNRDIKEQQDKLSAA